MPHVKFSKNVIFGTKKLKNKQKLQLIWTKFESFKSSKLLNNSDFQRKDSSYECIILYYIKLSPNNKFGM
jgi:hypothetical protein